MKVSRKEFEKLVAEAVDGLPPEFLQAVDNLTLAIEEEPSREDIESVGLDPDQDTLFGLYQGVPLPERDLGYSALPDRIVIYRGPILDFCLTREEVVLEVRETVQHELGHYFGLADPEMPY